MTAYYVYDAKKALDLIVIPETDRMVNVDRRALDMFISVSPDFEQLQGRPLNGLAPDTLGIVVATRKKDGDVCILDVELWQNRMNAVFGRP